MPVNLTLLTLFAVSSKPIRYPNHNREISTEPSVGESDSHLADFFLNTLK